MSCVLGILIGVLLYQYQQLRAHIDTIRGMQEQYALSINAVKELVRKHKKAALSYSNEPLRDNNTSRGEQEKHAPELLVEQSPDYSGKKMSSYQKDVSWKTKKPKRNSLTGITFALPIDRSQFWLSSFFGSRKNPQGQWEFHKGVDMAAHRGTLVKSVAAGVVEQAEYVSGYGNTVLVAHDSVYKTRYAHLDSIAVAVGTSLQEGENVGKVGDTGFTRKTGKDASHLHLEVYENGTQVNPAHLLTL